MYGAIKLSPKNRYYQYEEQIGSGQYKIVYKGYDSTKGTEIAWNVINLNNSSKDLKKAILEEITILRAITGKCQHIMKFYDAWIDKEDNTIIYITELGNYTLNSYINKVGRPEQNVIKKWARQILIALNFLHGNNIIHRDIKTTNIFILSMTGNVMIGDFGSARKFDMSCKTVIGTPLFMSPEIYSGEYDEKVDIYAFGLCLIELITGEIPYKEYMHVPMFVSCVIAKPPNAVDKILNEDAKKLVQTCIDPEPTNRPSTAQLLGNKYWMEIDREHVEIDMNLLTHKLLPAPSLSAGLTNKISGMVSHRKSLTRNSRHSNLKLNLNLTMLGTSDENADASTDHLICKESSDNLKYLQKMNNSDDSISIIINENETNPEQNKNSTPKSNHRSSRSSSKNQKSPKTTPKISPKGNNNNLDSDSKERLKYSPKISPKANRDDTPIDSPSDIMSDSPSDTTNDSPTESLKDDSKSNIKIGTRTCQKHGMSESDGVNNTNNTNNTNNANDANDANIDKSKGLPKRSKSVDSENQNVNSELQPPRQQKARSISVNASTYSKINNDHT